MKIDRPVFLVGFMGSGKTYWGSRLADSLGLPFYDLDSLIETLESNNIPGIFAQSGEEGFRIIEQETLQQCSQFGPSIVATGGGTPCFFDNMDWMNMVGYTVYLKTSAVMLTDRLKHEQQLRPLLAQVEAHDLESHIEKLLALREPFYAKASVVVEHQGDDSAFFDWLQGWFL